MALEIRSASVNKGTERTTVHNVLLVLNKADICVTSAVPSVLHDRVRATTAIGANRVGRGVDGDGAGHVDDGRLAAVLATCSTRHRPSRRHRQARRSGRHSR